MSSFQFLDVSGGDAGKTEFQGHQVFIAAVCG